MSTEEARTWFIRILLLGGLVWIGRALLWFANPIYWNPSTAIDYLAVVGTSLMFLFLAVVLWALYRLNPLPTSIKQKVWLVGIMLAIVGTVVLAVSNIAEDLLGLSTFGFAFGYGALATMLGLLLAALGALIHAETRLRLGWFFLACIAGLTFLNFGGGFVVGFALWLLAWIERKANVRAA